MLKPPSVKSEMKSFCQMANCVADGTCMLARKFHENLPQSSLSIEGDSRRPTSHATSVGLLPSLPRPMAFVRIVAPTFEAPAEFRWDPLIDTAFSKVEANLVALLSRTLPCMVLLWLGYLCGLVSISAVLLQAFYVVVAVYLPSGPLEEFKWHVSISLVLQSGIEFYCGVSRALASYQSDGDLRYMHGLRAAVPIYFAAALSLLAFDCWRCRCSRFWEGLRLTVISGSGVRLAVNWVLYDLDAVANSHLPGNISYKASLAFELINIVVYGVVLAPANRHRLSELFGRSIVQCSLAELPTPTQTGSVRCDTATHDDTASSHPTIESDAGGGASARDSTPRQRHSQRSSFAGSSVVSSAASELGDSLPATFAGAGSSLRRDAYPLHPLRPQYYQDAADYLDPSTRARQRLQVRNGLLIDSDGRLLAPDGELEEMYVVDAAGEVYTSFGLLNPDGRAAKAAAAKAADPDPTLRHSSLVAGAPVAAAGMLTVSRGLLLRLSNESGHYAPPASCLNCIMDRLAFLGVARLDAVALEIVRRPKYGTGATAGGAGATLAISSREGHQSGASPGAPLRNRRPARSPPRRLNSIESR